MPKQTRRFTLVSGELAIAASMWVANIQYRCDESFQENLIRLRYKGQEVNALSTSLDEMPDPNDPTLRQTMLYLPPLWGTLLDEFSLEITPLSNISAL